jgi:hypothetical protein
MTPEAIADAYFAAMHAQDVEALLALFTPGGVIVWPDCRALSGHTEIRAAYARMFQAPGNNPRPGPLMIAAGRFSCEVHSRLPDGSERRTVNVFELGEDGLVRRMASYKQG